MTDPTREERASDLRAAAMAHANQQPRPNMLTHDGFRAAVTAERLRQIAKGYDQAHDDEHGTDHLLVWAQDYTRRGELLKAAALIEAAREKLARDDAASGHEEDREALARVVHEANPWSGWGAAYRVADAVLAARRSPMPPSEEVASCEVCGRPATYRLGMPTPKWCDVHGPRPSAPREDVAVLDADARERVEGAVREQLAAAGLDPEGPPYATDGENRWPIAAEIASRAAAAVVDALRSRTSIGCSKHPKGTAEPCKPCRDARLVVEASRG